MLRWIIRLSAGGSIFVLALYCLLDYGVGLYLGWKGHELAWRNRRFDSLDEFFKVQRAWMIGGFAWQIFWIGLLVWFFSAIASSSPS